MYNPFQRQEELKGWNQQIVSKLKCLVLGVGGLGSTIAMDLCRLGVTEINLVDMDTVDAHNLNRQILYRPEHVGKYKVDCAKEELDRHHNVKSIPTKIISHNIDALEHWQTTINLIKESDVVFNTIDHGDYFDFVVFSMAYKFNKIAILGGTEPFYGMTISYFLQGIKYEDQKYWECHDLKMKELEQIINIENLENLESITCLPKDSHPIIGGSTVFSAGICAHNMVCAVINYLLHLCSVERPDPPKNTIENLMTFETTRWFSTNIDELIEKKDKIKYIFYTGIGSNGKSKHTEEEFLNIMTSHRHRFQGDALENDDWHNLFLNNMSLEDWIEFSGAKLIVE